MLIIINSVGWSWMMIICPFFSTFSVGYFYFFFINPFTVPNPHQPPYSILVVFWRKLIKKKNTGFSGYNNNNALYVITKNFFFFFSASYMDGWKWRSGGCCCWVWFSSFFFWLLLLLCVFFFASNIHQAYIHTQTTTTVNDFYY